MTSASDIVARARAVTPGHRYVMGAKPPLDTSPDAMNTANTDCSGFVRWVLAPAAALPFNSHEQADWLRTYGVEIPVGVAYTVPGAVIFIDRGAAFGGGHGNHVGLSDGIGGCIQARSTAMGVGTWPIASHAWTNAFQAPGVEYPAAPVPLPPSQEDHMTPVVVPAGTMPDPNGRIAFFELHDWGNGHWSILGHGGATLNGSAPTLDPSTSSVDLPFPLAAPPVGMVQVASDILVLAADGGTFGYRITAP